jgi:hypothetical protein
MLMGFAVAMSLLEVIAMVLPGDWGNFARITSSTRPK